MNNKRVHFLLPVFALLTACTQQQKPTTPATPERATYADAIRLGQKYGIETKQSSPNARINYNQQLPIDISADSLEVIFKRSADLEKTHKPLNDQLEAFGKRTKGKSPKEVFAIMEEYPLVLKASIESAGGQQQFDKGKADVIAIEEKSKSGK